jgi:chaperone required for assembly of F1-ATPase
LSAARKKGQSFDKLRIIGFRDANLSMKRFYTSAATAPVDNGHVMLLDGRAIKTPKRAQLIVPTPALAQAIAAEWDAQVGDIRPETMPLTGMANAAIDLIAPDPVAFAMPLAAYAESDLLCYRSHDKELAALEAAEWNPILAWAENLYGVEFALATGIVHVAQPDLTLARLRDVLLAFDPFGLAALAPLITIGGSLVVALALAEDAVDSDALWAAVNFDEYWQEQRWGVDADAVAARVAKQREWDAAVRFLGLLTP